MRKNRHHIIGLLTMLLTIVACTDENTFPSDATSYVPSLNSRYLHLSATTLQMDAAAGSKNLQVEASATPWQFRDFDTSWLSLNPATGDGDATVTFTAREHTSVADVRTSIFTFESTQSDFNYQKQVSVTQQKAAPSIRLSETAVNIQAAGGAKTVTVNSNVPFTIEGAPSWLAVTPSSDGSAIVITAQPNTTTAERQATITLNGAGATATISVKQAKPSTPVANPAELLFPCGGGAFQLTITSEVPWTATTNQAWLDVRPSEGSGGSATLTVEATAWTGTADRTGFVYIHIGSTQVLAISIRQSGIYLQVEPTSLSFGVDGEEKAALVRSNTNWMVLSKPEWLTTSSNGDATILNVTAQPNPTSSNRSGTIMLTHQGGTTALATISVSQVARTFSVAPTAAISHPSKGGTHQVTISGNDPWTATSSSTWMALSQRSGNGNINVTLTTPDNPSIYPREDRTTFTPTYLAPVTIVTTQAARYLLVDATTLTFFSKGGKSEAITINTDATYTVSSSASWLTVQRQGNTFTATAAENTTGADRKATIAVAMTGLNSGESYRVEIPVTQYFISPGITIDTFTADEQWDIIRSATATITITGFGSDEQWD